MAASEGKPAKIAFGHLLRDLDSSLCTQCGTCVAVCPYGSIEIMEEGVSLTGYCGVCGLCYCQCPQFTNVNDDAGKIFGERPGSESIGVYKNAYSGRTNLPEVEKNAQNGGVVTTLLVSLLEDGFIDGAVVTGTGDQPWKPEPKVAISPEEVIRNAGTIYSHSSVVKGLRDVVDNYGRKNLAVVGTPCQVKGLRQLELSDRKADRIGSRVKLIIGLFCMESFPYDNILKIVEEDLGLDISEVSKFEKGEDNLLVHTAAGSESVPLDKLKDYMNSFCNVCLDYSAELADISVGNAGVPAGRNSVITRTEVGEESYRRVVDADRLESSPLSDVDPGIALIEKLSNEKRKERKEEIERRIEEGEPVPPRAKKSEGE